MDKVSETVEIAKLQAELIESKKQVNELNYQLLNATQDRKKLQFLHMAVDAAVEEADENEYNEQCKTALCYVSQELQKYADPLQEINRPAPLIVQELKSA